MKEVEKMKMMKRTLVLIMAAALLLLSGCGGSAKKDDTLNIYTWADYFPADICEEFTEQTGIAINYNTFESNEEMLMKLQAGGEYDIVLASDYIIDIARQEGLIKKLDKEKIPNFGNIDPQFQSKFYDPENEYTVPYAAGIPLIIYNPDMVGDVQIKGYEDLWNPAFADSVVVMDDARNVIGITLKTMGKSFNETDPAVLEEAKAKLLTLKPNIRALDYSTPYNLMIGGETAVGYMFTSQVITVLNEKPDFKVVYPEEGLGFGIDNIFVPEKAPHADNAFRFLNFILDGKRSAHITDQIFYISCNKAAAEHLQNQALTIPDGAADSAEFIQDVGDAAQIYNDIWTEFKQS